jgi:hypothetical protein
MDILGTPPEGAILYWVCVFSAMPHMKTGVEFSSCGSCLCSESSGFGIREASLGCSEVSQHLSIGISAYLLLAYHKHVNFFLFMFLFI